MYQLLLTLLFFISALFHLHAEDVHVVEIRYEIYVENEDKLSTFQYKLPYETFHIVSKDHILTLNKFAADVDEVHIYDLANKLDYQCFLKGENQSIAVKSPLSQIPTLVTDQSDDQIYQIGGTRCQRYEILHKGKPIEIYTTDVFGVDFTPFSQVQGYAMQYTFVDEVYGKVTYIAKSIYPTTTSESTFSLEGFQVTDKLFSQDKRNSIDERLISKESKSLFKLNKKNVDYKFKLTDKSIVSNKSNPKSLVMMTICDYHKLGPIDFELMKNLISSMEDKNVNFYLFAQELHYSKEEIAALESIGFQVAYIKDLILNKFKIDYFPTHILLDKDRKVIKYKIGTNSEMLSTFSEKIIELSDD